MTRPVDLQRLATSGPHCRICFTFSRLMIRGLAMPAHLITTHDRSRISFLRGWPPAAWLWWGMLGWFALVWAAVRRWSADAAGLVAGASKGEGLGNQFLANIRETDAIVNVVRCFDDENVVHVNGKVDPIADIETIVTELALADMSAVEKAIHRESKKGRAGDKDAQKLVTLLEKLLPHLNEGQPARTMQLTDDDKLLLKPLCLMTLKPAMYVGNVMEDGFENNPYLDRLREHAAKEGAPVVALCASAPVCAILNGIANIWYKTLPALFSRRG